MARAASTVWEMEGWHQGIWSVYTFSTEKEAVAKRAELERLYRTPAKASCGTTTFEIYKTVRTVVPRAKRRKRQRLDK
jgi:hypothetical protein